MTIIKIRQPVEYSFLQWINNFLDSGHWSDKERFFKFVKTVCRYNAKSWENSNYVKNKILELKPLFDPLFLERLLELYDNLIQFYKTEPYSDTRLNDKKSVKKGHYIEIRIKKGMICERELPRKL